MRMSERLLFHGLLASVVVLGAIAVGATQLASAKDSDAPVKPSVQSAIAGGVLHFSTEQYLNYEYRKADSLTKQQKDAQSRTVTEKWIETGSDGQIVRFRSTTRLPDGSVWQDQLYENGKELVNFYQWSDRNLACSQTMNLGPAGQPFTTVSPADLKSKGFAAAERPRDVSSANAQGIGRAFEKAQAADGTPFNHRSLIAVVDSGTGQLLGDFIYGVQSRGGETLLESRISTVAAVAPPPPGIFAMEALPNCSHPPQQ